MEEKEFHCPITPFIKELRNLNYEERQLEEFKKREEAMIKQRVSDIRLKLK